MLCVSTHRDWNKMETTMQKKSLCISLNKKNGKESTRVLGKNNIVIFNLHLFIIGLGCGLVRNRRQSIIRTNDAIMRHMQDTLVCKWLIRTPCHWLLEILITVMSNIRRTKSQDLNVSRLVLQLLYQIRWSQVLNQDVLGAAPTTSEWSTILLPTKMCLILEVYRYIVITITISHFHIFTTLFCTKSSNECFVAIWTRSVYPGKDYLTNDVLKENLSLLMLSCILRSPPPCGLRASGQTLP